MATCLPACQRKRVEEVLTTDMQNGPVDTANALDATPFGARLTWRMFHVLLALTALSVAISLGGRWFGGRISDGGHTSSTHRFEVVIGNNVLSVPANAIRFAKARRDGVVRRLDLYLHWPDLVGYTETTRDAFNDADGGRQILFLTFEQRAMPHDMSARFGPIYRNLIELPGKPGPAGLRFHRFKPGSGYSDEVLAVAKRLGQTPFVARCISSTFSAQSLAPCQRDVQLGEGLSLTYRFSEALLPDWNRLETAIVASADAYLQTDE